MADADGSRDVVLIRMSAADTQIQQETADKDSSGDASRHGGKIKAETAERQ